jgi:hypothetical protein
VRTSVVRRHDLDVERVIASIDVVLDADVRELDVAAIVAGKVVFPCPVLDLERCAVWPAVGVVATAIAFLQELLILAFQVVLEDDTVDVRAFVTEAFGFLGVGAIEFRVMLQFARLRDAGIEGLAIARVIVQTPRSSRSRPSFVSVTTVWSRSRRTV